PSPRTAREKTAPRFGREQRGKSGRPAGRFTFADCSPIISALAWLMSMSLRNRVTLQNKHLRLRQECGCACRAIIAREQVRREPRLLRNSSGGHFVHADTGPICFEVI